MKLLYLALLPSACLAILLWPIPQHMETGEIQLLLDSSFYISGPDNEYLQDAIDRYTQLITRERWDPVPYETTNITSNVSHNTLEVLRIEVEREDDELEFGVDESYILEVPNQRSAFLTSKTVWGALRGLETFSQLVQSRPNQNDLTDDGDDENYDPEYDYDENDYDDNEDENEDLDFEGLYIPNTPIVIKDAPKYYHRGIMLDTARNFYPVFHWHITDSQSFPLKLRHSPELANQGAYKLHQKRLVYTRKDVQHVIEYAYRRGVRVIPEIDMPAHTGSWGLSHKDITTCTGLHYLDSTGDWGNRLAAEPTTGQLNPIKDKTYDIVNKVIKEVTSLFKDSWYHGGGDEPVYKCWEQDESVRQYMKEKNVTGVDLLGSFLEKELDMIRDSKKTAILWEDAATNDNLPIPKDVVLQVWTNPLHKAVKKGYKVIASNYNFWYLDCGHGGWGGNDTSYDEQEKPKINPEVSAILEKYELSDNYNTLNWGGPGGDWCSPYKSWQRVYSYDLEYNLTAKEAENVLGGETALWSEQSDPVSLDNKLWPRAAAAAEVLWSGRYDYKHKRRSIGDAMGRMFDWRYRLVARNINAVAIQPLWW
ncbi:glycoside hydrolase family 20 protein [Backusella circina FSU 941]|nr:glycoside hydrolase family 20 protein [Backusella circina FSU 941]